jgi:hypothetical protein
MATRPRGGDERHRADLVRQWRASGESQTAFARQQGIHPRTFWGWCRDGVGAAPTFVPVQIMETTSAPTLATVVIVLATGDRIEVQGADNGVLLMQAVAALRRAC